MKASFNGDADPLRVSVVSHPSALAALAALAEAAHALELTVNRQRSRLGQCPALGRDERAWEVGSIGLLWLSASANGERTGHVPIEGGLSIQGHSAPPSIQLNAVSACGTAAATLNDP